MITIDIIAHKIIPADKLRNIISLWRFKDEKIVFTNGCFDIIHQGHLQTLAYAADQGTKLIVGLNTDASISRLKGSERPIQDQHSRALLLASLSYVDAVVLFDEDTPLHLIEQILPNVLIKGGDYREEDIVGYDIVTQNEGAVMVVPFLEGYSTTSLIAKIKQNEPTSDDGQQPTS